jgi:hypothetical protein
MRFHELLGDEYLVADSYPPWVKTVIDVNQAFPVVRRAGIPAGNCNERLS